MQGLVSAADIDAAAGACQLPGCYTSKREPYWGNGHVQGLVSAADIDAAAGRILAAKFRLGVFDAPEQVPFSAIPASTIGSDAHLALALEAAQKSASRTLLRFCTACGDCLMGGRSHKHCTSAHG